MSGTCTLKPHEFKGQTPNTSIAEQAAEWVLALDDLSKEEYQLKKREFEAWKKADPKHAVAAAKVEGFVSQISQLNDQAPLGNERAIKALDASLKHAVNRHRKQVTKALLTLILIAGLPAAVMLQSYPLSHLNADKIASAGQWQEHILADGSRITLSGKTAIDIDFTSEQRTIHLLSGEVFVDVAPDSNRPFIVTTINGSVEALGTRFVVNQGQTTRLNMFESKVLATPANNKQAALVIKAGERTQISATGLSSLGYFDPELMESNWHRRQLVVQGWPLDQVLTELNRYHKGHIHFEAEQLQMIKVSAVLPLDKPDAALGLLAENVGLKIRNISPWLVLIDKN